MKQVFSVLSVTCVAFFTIFLSTTNVSCKKGDTGPKGDTGNANVIYSGWLNVQYNEVVPQPGDTFYTATIQAPKITDSIINKGDVRVFINTGTAAAPEILPLPLSTIIIPFVSKGKIDLQAAFDYSTFTAQGNTYQQYRYIAIQGSVAARSNVNWNNWEEVKKTFNIPD
jgi:hypothetical protein